MKIISKIIFFINCLAFLLFISCSNDNSSLQKGNEFEDYYTYTEMQEFLLTTENNHSDIMTVKSIGTSVEGKNIWAVVISDNPDENEWEPRVRLTGYVHGNEKISGQMLLRFIDYLTSNYNSDFNITNLVNSRYIVIIPMLNPDGVEAGSRRNANNIDLNRNFSTEWKLYPDGGSSSIGGGTSYFSEPESIAFREFSIDTIFHLSATYHSGEVIINLPFDYDSNKSGNGNIPLENDLVMYLGRLYATTGTFLDNPDLLLNSYVHDGIINGGDWYIAYGTLQDWSYKESGCLDYTIEIADESPLYESGVEEVFDYNRNSLIAFIKSAGMGVHGRVNYDNGSAMSQVKVYVDEGDLQTYSDDNGYYHKILMPGDYTINFLSDDNLSYFQEITVPESGNQSIELNVTLSE